MSDLEQVTGQLDLEVVAVFLLLTLDRYLTKRSAIM